MLWCYAHSPKESTGALKSLQKIKISSVSLVSENCHLNYEDRELPTQGKPRSGLPLGVRPLPLVSVIMILRQFSEKGYRQWSLLTSWFQLEYSSPPGSCFSRFQLWAVNWGPEDDDLPFEVTIERSIGA